MKDPAVVVFGAAGLTCAWVYCGYPLLLLVLARLRPRPVLRAPGNLAVTLIIPSHNEEATLPAKLRNCLELDYPEDRLEVLVASDGSTDGSAAAVETLGDPRVRFLALPRVGKIEALNRAAAAAEGEILAFTDANTVLDRSALRRLMEPFADPTVGAATGRKLPLAQRFADSTARGEGAYWDWENRLKSLESQIGSCYIGDGALHAVRRRLFAPLVFHAQSDDMAISMRAVIQGYRLIFEPAAVVYEEGTESGSDEFRRKVRVTSHSLSALFHLGPALWTSGFYSVELISHKLLRHLVPFFLLLMLLASAVLAGSGVWWRLALAAQLGFYGAAAVGWLLRGQPVGRTPLLWMPYYFCLVNGAALVGTLRLILGRAPTRWVPRGS